MLCVYKIIITFSAAYVVLSESTKQFDHGNQIMSSFNTSNVKSADSCLSKLPCKLISKQYIDSEVCSLYGMIDCIKREYVSLVL